MTFKKVFIVCLLITVTSSSLKAQQSWKPVKGKLMTRWAKDVDPNHPLPEYPRPQLERKNWENLNGLWNYTITDRMQTGQPEHYDGKILVPFAIESSLSGVGREVGANRLLWYQRQFNISADWKGKHILLHFGACDWETTVYVNGMKVGSHSGGYDAFTFDITSYLLENRDQEITVSVWDPTDDGTQPRGKQTKKPGKITYTSVTGIWQTVWLEPVNKMHIKSIKYYPDIDRKICDIAIQTNRIEKGVKVKATIYEGKKMIATAIGTPRSNQWFNNLRLRISQVKLWSPEHPYLYNVKIELMKGEKVVDAINSYMGMRKISLDKDAEGIPRIMLNNKFVFQMGFLDQGWWPGGLYTAPTEAAILFDLKETKAFGYNLLRKHVKVEPARWYYNCDKMGILVWQDMPNTDMRPKTAQTSYEFQKELKTMIDQNSNHPCIVVWVPFNEGWGQFNTLEIANWIKKHDPTRLVNASSGVSGSFFDVRGAGDLNDKHKYPGPSIPENAKDGRALVIGEFGGLGLPIEGHTWESEKNWGYVTFKSPEELRKAYIDLIGKIPSLIKEGLSAAIYTQLTDVEKEVNGFMSYDREVGKLMSPETVNANKKLYKVFQEK